MPSTAKLIATFDSISDFIDNPPDVGGFRELEVEAACAELEAVLNSTILPRRVTISSQDGARLSVIARNRRVIKVADVSPANLWEGEQSPQATVCEGDYESFARDFASALLKVAAGQHIAIEQFFLSHALGTIAHSGYPASMLCEHALRSQADEGDATIVQNFYDNFPEQARARFGSINETDVPSNSNIDPAWLGARVVELKEELNGKDTDLRFMILGGANQRAMATVWFGDEGCTVVSENADRFDELELRLGALRSRL